MNIRVEPKRNSKAQIKKGDSLKDAFGCGMREGVGAKGGNESTK